MAQPTTSQRTRLATAPAPVDTTPEQPTRLPMTVMQPAVLLTASEVAELLRIDPYTVRRYVQRGELTAYRIGRELRFDIQDVQHYLAARRAG